MSANSPDSGQKSRRPKNSRFRQQKLPAWRPILTPISVLPIFVSVGIAFIITGGVLLAKNRDVTEEEFDYTHCNRLKDNREIGSLPDTCYELLKKNSSYRDTNSLQYRCECEVEVPLKGFAGKKTYIYYGLDNFYQNHRRYVKSRSDRQLRSRQYAGGESCEPLMQNGGLAYAPCGLIANSIFNDTIEIQESDNPSARVTLSGKGIAWKSDLDVRFKNPKTPPGTDLCQSEGFNPQKTIKPPNWPVEACKLGETRSPDTVTCNWRSAYDGNGSACMYNPWYGNDPKFSSSGRGYENEDLIVWMRVAALPKFRKPWRIVHDGLDDGKYKITVGYNFPVDTFDGKKKIIFTTTNSIGGDNPFVAGCYILVGILSLLGGIGFYFYTRITGGTRALGDVSSLHWDHH